MSRARLMKMVAEMAPVICYIHGIFCYPVNVGFGIAWFCPICKMEAEKKGGK
jgi:hypothetical protein